MALPREAIKLIQEFESCLRRVPGKPGYFAPYRCPANVPTIGWGNTRYPNGRRVTMADPAIPQETCDEYFASEIREDEAGFDRLNKAKLHSLMRGALVSFCYNCGTGAYGGSSLRRAVNSGRFQDVPRELKKWRMGGGRVLRGLERRRLAETSLFLKGLAALKREHNGGPPIEDGELPETPAIDMKEETNTPNKGFWSSIRRWLFK